MSEQRSLIVGFDLCNDYSQISCYSQKTNEPESICINSNQEKYLIPTVLGVKRDTKDWIFGEEAITCNQAGTAVLIDGLITLIDKEEETDIYGVKFQPITLLEKYIRKCLLLLKMYHPNNSIQKIAFTVKGHNEKLSAAVYKALEHLGIGRDRAMIQSHSQSYQYYALSQSKELWMNDIGLFEFDEVGLTYHQITINRKIHPYVVGMVEKDFTETLSYDMLLKLKDSDNLEYIFDNIAKSVLHKQIVSTIYITGKGFDGSWVDNVLKELCIGRRVFKGQNLYTKGACYAAKELTGEHKFDDFLFFSNEMIRSTFLIHGYYDAKAADIVLAKAATPWYEIDEKIDLILDEEKDVTFLVKDVTMRETIQYSIELDGLPERPNKTTRIELSIKFLNPTTAIIIVKDKGFGEFFPSTDKVWEKEITIQ